MIALMFIAALLLPPDPVDRTITIVFAQPAGEQFTIDEQHDAVVATRDASAWWEALSPIPTTLRIGATLFVTTTEDVYTTPPIIPGDLTVVVIDNTVSQRLIQGHTEGASSYDLGMIWLVTTGNNAARVAHELGHAVYNLPDWYQTPALCALIDIMCMSQRDAYVSRQIGCQSLGYLGYPCRVYRVYAPFTVWE